MTEEEFRTGVKKVIQDKATDTVFKDTNPKDAVGIRKVPMSCIPANVLMQLGLAMMEGARKYGRSNYRVVGVRASVYYDAALRHIMRWWEGRDIDPDSGLSELVKAMACLVVIQDSIDRGNWVDDRPPSTDGDWLEQLNKKAGDLIDRLPNAKDPYTNLNSPDQGVLPGFPIVATINWGDGEAEVVKGWYSDPHPTSGASES